MTKKPCKVQLTEEDFRELSSYAETNGLNTANTLLAAVSVELVKAKKKGLNVWHVLGRIAADDDAPTESAKRIRSAPLEIAR